MRSIGRGAAPSSDNERDGLVVALRLHSSSNRSSARPGISQLVGFAHCRRHVLVAFHQLADTARMKKNADGSLTLHVQKDSPGADRESNWLPAPNGPIYLVMRLYWPKTEAPSCPPYAGRHRPATDPLTSRSRNAP